MCHLCQKPPGGLCCTLDVPLYMNSKYVVFIVMYLFIATHKVRKNVSVCIFRSSVWKLQYLLTRNDSRVPVEQLKVIDLDLVANLILAIHGTEGRTYKLVTSTTGYFNYQNHYSVLFDKKVTESAKKMFKQRLLIAWYQLKPGELGLCLYVN